jgi:hypothetical protein
MSDTPPKDQEPKVRIQSLGDGRCRLEVDAVVPLDTALDVMNVLHAVVEPRGTTNKGDGPHSRLDGE